MQMLAILSSACKIADEERPDGGSAWCRQDGPAGSNAGERRAQRYSRDPRRGAGKPFPARDARTGTASSAAATQAGREGTRVRRAGSARARGIREGIEGQVRSEERRVGKEWRASR